MEYQQPNGAVYCGKDCLKHIIGYVLSCVKNNDVTCDTCDNSVLSTDKVTTDLSYFKNYKPDKLLIINSACLDFFLKAEMFRHIQENSLWDKQNVSRYVIQAIQESKI